MSLRADVSFVKEHAQVCSVMFSDVWRAAGSRIMMYLPIKKVLVIRLLSRWLLEQFDNDEMIWRQMMDRMYLLDAYDVATRCSLSSEIGERRLRFLKLWTQDQLRWKRTDYLKHMCHSFHRNSTFSAIPGKRSMRYSRIVDAEGNLGGGGPGQRRLAVEYSYGLIPREGPLSLGNPRCVDAVDTDGQVQRIDLLARQSLLQQGVVGGKLSVPNGYRTFYPLSGSCYAFVWASKDYLIVSLHDGTFAYLDHIKLPIDTAISCMTANDLPENSDVEFGSSLQRVNKLGSATSSDSLCQSVKEPPVQRMEPPVQRMEPPVQRQRSMDSNCETPTLPTTYVFGMADGRVFITTRKLTQALIMLPLLQSPVSALQVSDDGKTIVWTEGCRRSGDASVGCL
ncbi:hypothetical protein GNI_091820 [Gregarina niphandrodes]|uniref:Uncharacterized protein n=1 Tax=Gregarina niphandrodes TaxID=110365 RepID=A0A023B5D6_GRENI|nr:hypothetical protein GNI_091820 [Gregarina niphandrodes]EZG59765.1 hypothetical protein GNI_091820 [Gregarina niphandrodes]|eukprot:XP_011130879.1 hypothetical protein GNI_091820 [Gregarina niphandrodes]